MQPCYNGWWSTTWTNADLCPVRTPWTHFNSFSELKYFSQGDVWVYILHIYVSKLSAILYRPQMNDCGSMTRNVMLGNQHIVKQNVSGNVYMMPNWIYLRITPWTKWPPFRGRQFQTHFDDFFISIQTSLKYVPKDSVHNKAALVQGMAWRRTGDKPFPDTMLAQFTVAYMRTRGWWVK